MLLRRGVMSSGRGLFDANTANLDGSTMWFDAGNPAALQITGNQTIAIDYKFDVLPASSEAIASRYDNTATGRSWQLVYTSGTNQIRFDAFDDGTSTVGAQVFASPPVGGQWHSLVVVYNGVDLRLYIDNVLTDTTAYTGGFFNSGSDVFIGARARTDIAPDLQMDGSVALPRIWNSDLSASQVSQLYDGDKTICTNSLPASLKTDLVYAPRLANWGGNAGDELVDQSTSGITTSNIGSIPYNGTGLTIRCT
jgi:hypothetical protein